MSANEATWIPAHELAQVVAGPSHALEATLRGLDNSLVRVRQRAVSLGGGGTGMEVQQRAVQTLLDSGSIRVKPEYPEGSPLFRSYGSTAAFLAKYKLTAPDSLPHQK